VLFFEPVQEVDIVEVDVAGLVQRQDSLPKVCLQCAGGKPATVAMNESFLALRVVGDDHPVDGPCRDTEFDSGTLLVSISVNESLDDRVGMLLFHAQNDLSHEAPSFLSASSIL
jgi:hypothetical protein